MFKNQRSTSTRTIDDPIQKRARVQYGSSRARVRAELQGRPIPG